MGIFLQPSDVTAGTGGPSADQAELLIKDVEALALLEAPCLSEPTFAYLNAARAILRQAVLRWHRAGDGGVQSDQMSSGPFSFGQTFDTRVMGEGQLLAREIRQLQRLCKLHNGGARVPGRRAFTVRPGKGVL